MKKSISNILVMFLFLGFIYSCKKSVEKIYVSPAVISGTSYTGGVLGVKGSSIPTTYTTSITLKANNTYTLVGDIVISSGDTLLLQSGVKVCVQNSSTIIVKGVLISLGTQSAPNWFTACDVTKSDNIPQGENPASDPAWNGGAGTWTGIECDTSCKLLCIKWTHIEFVGAAYSVTEPFVGGSQGGTAFGILFQNPNGDFILEDSWMYGSVDDGVRIQNGRISIMRNTFEKISYTSGDNLNAKSGSVGDMAYNLFLGTATNGTKASNKGGQPIECNINMYNNTYVDGGYRQSSGVGRSADIDYEQGAEGYAYNNLIVNCRVGARIVNNPIADTAHCFMGNNYFYGDSVNIVDQAFPVGYITKPNAYFYPTAAQCGYVYNPNGAAAYDASALAGQGNPQFLNFPLPEPNITHLYDIAYVGSFNFHLQSASPCINQGNTSVHPAPFSPLKATKVTQVPFAAIVTNPGHDIGCYQSDGTGNQH